MSTLADIAAAKREMNEDAERRTAERAKTADVLRAAAAQIERGEMVACLVVAVPHHDQPQSVRVTDGLGATQGQMFCALGLINHQVDLMAREIAEVIEGGEG